MGHNAIFLAQKGHLPILSLKSNKFNIYYFVKGVYYSNNLSWNKKEIINTRLCKSVDKVITLVDYKICH